MAKLYLVASHGYPPGLFLHPAEQSGIGRAVKDYQPFLSNPGLSQDSLQPWSYKPRLHWTEDQLKPSIGMLDSNEFFRTDSTPRRPVLIDVQDLHPNSVHFSLGIVNQCILREKVLRFLMSGLSEVERGGVDLSLLSDLMGPQTPTLHIPQEPLLPSHGQSFLDAEPQLPLISLNSENFNEKALFAGDLGHVSEITFGKYHPEDRPSLTSSGTEMVDILTAISEFYVSKNSIKSKKQEMVVPYFDRRARKAATSTVTGSSPKLETAKSSEKVKYKASSKKKSNVKAVKERDLYRNNLFHTCESLLSIMVDKNRHGKTAILSLKRSGPELPKVLTQFSASIAGTGLAVLFSVVCKVACARVPFCASKLLNTGLGIGLVWLSWAVNRLRDTVISINKNSSKLDTREEEIMNKLDRSVKDIYFRAAALMAVAVLRIV
ncbi:hypothetical protein ACH5RR_020129 [Cinchona calisaya]|uniref:Uncharacterized protein n=1 Tax=Cinchona calisaya TaxID=153742 RepID=A0ABD2ZGV9_9GENT